MNKEAAKFREYVTSGAFKLTLSRVQLSTLSIVSSSGEKCCGSHTLAALKGKGLITEIQSDGEQSEIRLTAAGVFALKLARLADLTQGPADPVASELTSLRRELSQTRQHLRSCLDDCWEMRARVSHAETQVAIATAFVENRPEPPKPMVSLKVKQPGRTQSAILSSLDAARKCLESGQSD